MQLRYKPGAPTNVSVPVKVVGRAIAQKPCDIPTTAKSCGAKNVLLVVTVMAVILPNKCLYLLINWRKQYYRISFMCDQSHLDLRIRPWTRYAGDK
jgi:hypothetical protein